MKLKVVQGKEGVIDLVNCPVGEIEQKKFEVQNLNPFGYFLTKTSNDDLDVISKLLSDTKLLEDYAKQVPNQGRSRNLGRVETADASSGEGDEEEESDDEEEHKVAIMYGMKVGSGEGKIKKQQDPGSYAVYKGSDVATFYVNIPSSEGWIIPRDVEGKSVWGYTSSGWLPNVAYVLPTIVVAPIAAKFDPGKMAFSGSTIIFVPDDKWASFPWEIFLNSLIVRFVHHSVLRATILLRRRCTLYPRAVRMFPVSQKMLDREAELLPLSKELSELADKIKRRWIIIDEAMEDSEGKMLVSYPIDFSTWTGAAEGDLVLRRNGNTYRLTSQGDDGQLSLFYVESDNNELLNVVRYALKDKDVVSGNDLQKVKIPDSYVSVSKMIDEATNPNSAEIVQFRSVLEKADDIIFSCYNLLDSDIVYIKRRLSEFPFGRLEPRYPWTIGKYQKTRTYVEDRFAV